MAPVAKVDVNKRNNIAFYELFKLEKVSNIAASAILNRHFRFFVLSFVSLSITSASATAHLERVLLTGMRVTW